MPEIGQQRPVAFQFGVFELNPRTRELRKHGMKLKIQDQPLHILVFLLEHPGEIVTREEIQKRLWPDNTYVDFDNAINSAMRKLRDALGDSPENPRFIETLARRGYRFIAPVSRPVAADHSQTVSVTAEEQIEPAVPKHRVRWAVPVAVAAAVLAAIGLSISGREKRQYSTRPSSASHELRGFSIVPELFARGHACCFFMGEPGKRPSNIYVKMIGPGEPVRLTSNPNGDFAPAWSPDGRLIAFLRASDDEQPAVMTYQLWVVRNGN